MFCPKCHQPVEGDEEYVCCAGAALQWRCTSCAKVSDGFAFPYGMCPQCGGKLEALNAREVEGDAAMEAIRTAFEIELGGLSFYRQASRQADEPILKELFAKMAAMEEEHMETLQRRYHVAPPPQPKQFPVALAAAAGGLQSRPEDPANLFRLAIAFEQRAVDFFTQRSTSAPESSPERQLYRELAAEEREHAALLETELARWRAGKGGLL
jgi:glutamate synthase (NADPH) small chain